MARKSDQIASVVRDLEYIVGRLQMEMYSDVYAVEAAERALKKAQAQYEKAKQLLDSSRKAYESRGESLNQARAALKRQLELEKNEKKEKR